MSTLYALKFNNYYNRRIKKHNNLSDYPYPEYIETGTYCNFNPNDGINTEIILGRPGYNNYYGDCDYFIYSEDNVNITSRWFIIEQTRKMGNQYKVTLHRDVLADNWEKVIAADCFIEKATLSDDNPLIYNQESITTNQIKQNEILLKDESGCGWLIGYMDKEHENNNATQIIADAVPDYSVTTYSDISTWIGATEGTSYKKINIDTYTFEAYESGYYQHGTNGYVWYRATYNAKTQAWTITRGNFTGYANGIVFSNGNLSHILSHISSNVFTNNLNSYLDSSYNSVKFNSIYNKQSQIIEVTTGTDAGYYKIDANFNNINTQINVTSGSMLSDLNAAVASYVVSGTVKSITINLNNDTANYAITPIAYGTYTATLGNITSRFHNKDAFDIFCIPYSDVEIRNSQKNDWVNFTINKSLALSIAQGLAIALDTHLYDLQLLPYCPMTGLNYGEGYIDINNSSDKRYRIIKNASNNPVCVLLWSTSSKGTININQTIALDNKKIQNQTQILRLSSPNYSGQFDMNVAKNNGINSFNIDYTYLPYRPYIHVQPIWNANGLYGKDYNDAKGLICGGDFSITYTSSAWEKYQTENKNFENIFNRETEHLEVNHKYEMIQNGISAATGAAGTGIAAGILGGPIFGAVSGIASALGGAADLSIKQSLFNESMDYRQDLFQMQLDNIKALPNSLTKVTAINENNKIFPFIEIYDCTETEKKAVANKIAWNGMTVGIIDKIENYLANSWSYGEITDNGYIKGKLIRLEEIDEDFHNLQAIADELNKGVYTK